MNSAIFIGFILLALLLPAIFYWLYFSTVEKRSRKKIQAYVSNSSQTFTNLSVWFKNVDVFKKKNRFALDPFDTLYAFNKCDFILNDRYALMIGKAKFLGRQTLLMPTVLQFDRSAATFQSMHVKVERIYDIDNDLAIEFSDAKYQNRITLVIKRADSGLKEAIKGRGVAL